MIRFLVQNVFLFIFSFPTFLVCSESKPDAPNFGTVLSINNTTVNWNAVKFVYAFGDSYTFVQGTEGHANFSFIGDALNLNFTKMQLLTDEVIERNTSSGGANWVEFLTGCFSGRPLDCTPRQLWDFAFAGADIDGSLLPLHHPFTIPLVDQVKQFIDFAAYVLPHPESETLTAWWIGINDTGDTVGNATITDFDAFWEKEMVSLFDAVEEVHSSGLRGTHLFLSVPPEERSPAHLNSTNAATLKQNTIDFNTALHIHAARFAAAHETDGTTVLLFDAHGWFNWALNEASNLGFTNVTGFCECTNQPGNFWFDAGHPTEPVHELLAGALNKFLDGISRH